MRDPDATSDRGDTGAQVRQRPSAVVADITLSLDGYVAGAGVGPDLPLGEGGARLAWYGDDVNDPGARVSSYDDVDAEVLAESGVREGAVIMGRTTFDVSIGEWGEEPPLRKPCFVLTHRPEPVVALAGGTTFTFVTDPWDALRQARRAAGGRDVGIMGGAATVRQYLMAGLLDELHLHLVPVVLGSGVRLFEHPGPELVHFRTARVRDGGKATHLQYRAVERVDRASKLMPASPEEVHRAFAVPGALERWLPPDTMTGTMLHFDFRDGGSYRMRLDYAEPGSGRGKSSADSDVVEVRLTKLDAGRSIVQEVTFDSEDPSFAGTMRMTWTFRPHPDGTLVGVQATGVPPGIVPEDHVQGLSTSLDQLARFVAGEP